MPSVSATVPLAAVSAEPTVDRPAIDGLPVAALLGTTYSYWTFAVEQSLLLPTVSACCAWNSTVAALGNSLAVTVTVNGASVSVTSVAALAGASATQVDFVVERDLAALLAHRDLDLGRGVVAGAGRARGERERGRPVRLHAVHLVPALRGQRGVGEVGGVAELVLDG